MHTYLDWVLIIVYTDHMISHAKYYQIKTAIVLIIRFDLKTKLSVLVMGRITAITMD